jgi:hypothetical protein
VIDKKHDMIMINPNPSWATLNPWATRSSKSLTKRPKTVAHSPAGDPDKATEAQPFNGKRQNLNRSKPRERRAEEKTSVSSVSSWLHQLWLVVLID